jgi:hypothetical protein
LKLLVLFLILNITNAFAIRQGSERVNSGQHVQITGGSGHCSGVRIHQNFILSVAHCFQRKDQIAKVSFIENKKLITQNIAVSDVIIKGTTSSEELAIIPIISNDTKYIAPKITLKQNFKRSQIFSIWGYGVKTDAGVGQLRTGHVKYNSSYRPAGRDNMLVMKPTPNNQLPCPGDSGGGLFLDDEKTLVGIASFINNPHQSLRGKSIQEKCTIATRAYYIQLSHHMPFLSRYLDATNRP